MTANTTPAVSVILPTFNRGSFLEQAFDSIRAQLCADWELIVVDDGSTDDTRATVARLAATMTQRVQYVHQANGGAYAARNTGVAHATGEYLAFFDSDDLWLPHHLERCLKAFHRHPHLDWVWGSCRRIDHATGRVIDENAFYVDGVPRPFLSMRTVDDGDLRIIDDASAIECQILHGFFCGLQNSLIRRRLFDGQRFVDRYRVVEDELFLIRALARGARVAYYLEPHVIYRVHAMNSSASNSTGADEKTLSIFHELVDGFEDLLVRAPLSAPARRATRKRLSREYFWHLGYHGLWLSGRRREAMQAFRQGLRVWPWDWRLWKTYLASAVRITAAGSHA